VGRPQAFDTDAAVRSARSVFWRLGYESTSIPDLEAATGLNRSSIYHAFGNKRGLFDASVESYLSEVVRPRLRPLTGDTVAPTALIDYLTGLRSALAERSALAADGCMLINAAGSRIGQDEAVGDAIAGYQRELRAAFRSGLRAAHPHLDGATADRGSRTITALVVTALALTRVDFAAAVENLDAAIDLAR
jgi:AcrR family transcriptional regulator